MPYFDDVKKKRTTRADHMRQDAWKEDEGAGYRKGSYGSKGRNSKPDMYRKDERGGYHSANDKGGKRDFDRKNDRGGRDFDRKNDRGGRDFYSKGAPRPQAERRPAPRPAAPAPKPVVVEEEVINNILTGRNPIREALKSGRDIEKLMVYVCFLPRKGRRPSWPDGSRHRVRQGPCIRRSGRTPRKRSL